MDKQKHWRSTWKGNDMNKATNVLLIIYLLVLVWILLFKLGVRFSYMENRSVNLIPFREFLLFHIKIDRSELILNVVIFIPLGIYAGVLYKRWTFGTKLFFFFFLSLLVEGLQYLLRAGAFDSTDILTNTLGGVIGLLVLHAVEKIVNNSARTQRLTNIIAAIGTAVVISLLILLKLNLLPIRYQ
jgi:glycopeptide antibiotics resistance protein